MKFKKSLSILLSILMAISCISGIDFSAYALESSGSCGENVTYRFNEETGELVISGTGDMTTYSWSESPFYNDSRIKSVVINSGVTSIGDYAFRNCTDLTSVTIPDGVTSIGDYAFYNCKSLTSITIGNSVTSIGSSAFRNCTGLTSVTIPDSVTSIGEYAFYDCSGLTSVTIPNSVTSIGNYAFGRVNNVVYNGTASGSPWWAKAVNGYVDGYLVYKDSSKKELLGCSSAFKGNLIIPNSVTSISDYAFYNCTGLTSVTIPDGVTSIGNYAFYICTGLTSVTIPNSVTSIGNYAFGGVNNVVYNGTASGSPWGAKAVNGYVDGDLVYKDSSKKELLGCSSAFKGNLIIPNSVTSISDYAFYNCTGLTSVTIGNSVTSIGSFAFWYCTGLTSVTIGNSVTSIGGSAFYECTGLASVTIPNSVTSIGESAFEYCTSLTSVTIPDSVTSIDDRAFAYCTGLASVTIGNSVTSIGENAFYNCTGLTSVTIPDSVTSIGIYAFAYCTGLTSVTIGNSVTSISDMAFSDCYNLTSVTIGNSVTSIGYDAFAYCIGLTSISIPNSVTSISMYAFYDCINLADVYYKGTQGDWNKITVGKYNECLKSATIHFLGSEHTEHIYSLVKTLPSTCIQQGYELYRCSVCGDELKEMLALSNTHDFGDGTEAVCLVCGAENEAIIDDENIETGSCGENVTYRFNEETGELVISGTGDMTNYSWNKSPFYNDSRIKSVVINSGVTSIGDYAFFACEGLTSVTIGNSVTSIGSFAFSDCTGLTSVTIPDSVTSIGETAFEYCTSLTSVTIPNSVTSIGEYAFWYCTGLTSVTIPNSVTSIGNYAFGRVNNVVYNGTASGSPWWAKAVNGYVDGYLVYKDSSKKELLGCSSAFKGNLIIPNSVTSIGGGAFINCTGLISVTIPNSVTSIGDSAFEFCTGLTSITIPDSVTSIDDRAFAYCTGLASVTIPNGVTSIDDWAFYNCTGLTSVTIPNSVTSIGYFAFDYCTNLADVYYKGNQEDWNRISISSKNECLTSATIHFLGSEHTEHSYQLIETVASTCMVLGHNTYRCTICNDEYTEALKELGAHNFGDGTEAVCLVCGAENEAIIYDENIETGSCGENVTYRLNKTTGKLVISGTGDMTNYSYNEHSPFWSNSSIKSVIINSGVTSICEFAFFGCTGLTNVTIPDSVTSIGDGVFSSCINLNSIIVDKDNKIYDSRNNCNAIINTSTNSLVAGCGNTIIPNSVTNIGEYAFYNCTSLTSVTIPDSVISIGDYAFYNCPGLTSISILDSVTSIGDWAFYDCTGLTSVTIPNSVTSIGNYAFYICTGLTSITIPDSVTSIGDGAFGGCNGLTSVTIPDSVTRIDDFTFGDCEGLTSVTIPDSVISIGDGAFYDCSRLADVFYKGTQGDWNKITVGEYNECLKSATIHFLGSEHTEHTYELVEAVESTCMVLGHNTYRCTICNDEYTEALKELGAHNFGNGSEPVCLVCGAENEAIIDDENIETGSCGENVTYRLNKTTGELVISGTGDMTNYSNDEERSPFYENSSVKSVVINSGVTSIGDYAFRHCTSLTNITIPDSVTSVGSHAFAYCTGLTNVTISDSVTSIGSYAFYDCEGLTSVTIGNGVTSIGSSAFEYCTGLTSVTIPDSVTSIDYRAFYDCTGLTSVTIPNSVTSIGNYAFCFCYNLTSVTIPNSVTSIGDAAFWCCTGLTSVTIGNSVTSIGSSAFYKCTGLTSVTIPNSVTSIGSSAFYRVNNVVYNGTASGSPWWAKAVNGYVDGDLVYKDSSKKELLGCSSAFKGNLIIPNSVTSIGNYAFYECTGLTSVTIPNSVTSIGNYAFYECTGLASVTIGNGVTSIGEYAFYECTNLADVYYKGNQKDWNKIGIGSYNGYLTSATIHFHDCTYVEIERLDKTCKSQGYIKYICSSCGFEFYEYIAPSHSIVVTHENEIAPTCTENGSYTEVKTCNDCGELIARVQKIKDPLGHNFTNYISDENATCTADGTKTAKCDRCDETNTVTDVDSKRHDYVCTTVQPTCFVNGYLQYNCTRCDSKFRQYPEELIAIGQHTPADAVAENRVEPTCTQSGSYDEVVRCSVCNEELSRKSQSIRALKHGSQKGDYDVQLQFSPVYTGGYFDYDECSTSESGFDYSMLQDAPLTYNYSKNGSTLSGSLVLEADKTVPICNYFDVHPLQEDRELGVGDYFAVTVVVDGAKSIYNSEQIIKYSSNIEPAGLYTRSVSRKTYYGLAGISEMTDFATGGLKAVDMYSASNLYKGVDDSINASEINADERIIYSRNYASSTVDVSSIYNDNYDFVNPFDGSLDYHYDNRMVCNTFIFKIIDDGNIEFTADEKSLTYRAEAGSRENNMVTFQAETALQTETVEETIEPTATANGVHIVKTICSLCGEELSREETIISRHQHSYTLVETVESTCSKVGYYKYRCAECNDEYVQTIDKIAHTPNSAVVENRVEPTCISNGSYDEVVYCSVCNEEISRTTYSIDMVAHSYTSKVLVEANCIQNGLIEFSCLTCSDRYTMETYNVDNHTAGYSEINNFVPNSCTTDGSYEKYYYCALCNSNYRVDKVVIPKTNHVEYKQFNVEVQPTCVEDGLYVKSIYCFECKAELSREEVTLPKTGHSFAYKTAVKNNLIYSCVACEEEISMTKDEVMAMWGAEYVNHSSEENPYLELVDDGVINAKDYAKLIKIPNE